MQLIYQWIDKYRSINDNNLLNNLELNFHHKYRFKYDGKDKLEFEILEKTNYIDTYYKENQYYSMIVGKNGSGKSSIFEMLYNGINISLDMKSRKEKIRDKFIAIFLHEDKFLFYGFKINNLFIDIRKNSLIITLLLVLYYYHYFQFKLKNQISFKTNKPSKSVHLIFNITQN